METVGGVIGSPTRSKTCGSSSVTMVIMSLRGAMSRESEVEKGPAAASAVKPTHTQPIVTS